MFPRTPESSLRYTEVTVVEFAQVRLAPYNYAFLAVKLKVYLQCTHCSFDGQKKTNTKTSVITEVMMAGGVEVGLHVPPK